MEYKTLKLDGKENYSPLGGSDIGTEVQRGSSSSEIHRIQSPTAHGQEFLTVTRSASRRVLHWITSNGHFQLTEFCGSRTGNRKIKILG